MEDDKSIARTRLANADAYLADDLALSRLSPRLTHEDSIEPDGLPRRTAEQLLREVDEFLAEHEVRSKGELDFLLAKIDSALAINNSPDAKRLREDLIRKFGDDARK